MYSPWGLVLVEGAQKEWNTRLEAVMPDFCEYLHGVWMEGLKAESMQTLARWHWAPGRDSGHSIYWSIKGVF